MTGYRVDRRDFEVGDVVAPTGQYQKGLNDKQKQVEAALESTRPAAKPKRDEKLFVFRDVEPAKKFWSKMQKGKLYKVDYKEAATKHTGDMNLTEEMFNRLDDKKALVDRAKRYWNGTMADGAEVEILVDEANVTEVISKDDVERHQYQKKRLGLA
jgi:hypothetical protein